MADILLLHKKVVPGPFNGYMIERLGLWIRGVYVYGMLHFIVSPERRPPGPIWSRVRPKKWLSAAESGRVT